MTARIRRVNRAPIQQSLDLAVPGNYLNNITPSEAISHWLVGTPTEYAAAQLVERHVDAALGEANAAHEEAVRELEEKHSSDLYSAHEELNDLLSEYQFDRLSEEEFLTKLYKLNNVLAVMHSDSTCSYRDAVIKVDAAMNSKTKRVARTAEG